MATVKKHFDWNHRPDHPGEPAREPSLVDVAGYVPIGVRIKQFELQGLKNVGYRIGAYDIDDIDKDDWLMMQRAFKPHPDLIELDSAIKYLKAKNEAQKEKVRQEALARTSEGKKTAQPEAVLKPEGDSPNNP